MQGVYLVACIIAFFVFAFLAIFSAKYRPLAKEAFRCVFNTITFRPCDVQLSEKIKATVVGGIMEKSPGTARFVNKHFEALSWIFTILTVVSLAYVLLGLYNFFVFGSCDPSDPSGCILTQLTNGSSTNTLNGTCTITADFAEFYGSECQYCKQMEPIVAQVEKETGIKFEKLEIWHNQTNAKTFEIHSFEVKRDCMGALGVPTFYSVKNKKAICGLQSIEELKKFVNENK
jgi:thiol-disulfide isomerase/thioredoxin